MSGREWIVEAYGCDTGALCDSDALRLLFDRLIEEMGLHPVADAAWHRFPGAGGVTGVALLSESHIACHTFPEYGSLCLNVFCCRARPDWDFERYLTREFGAASVKVRRIERPYGDAPARAASDDE
jgi:S-adenosylmethionine decarboxylase